MSSVSSIVPFLLNIVSPPTLYRPDGYTNFKEALFGPTIPEALFPNKSSGILQRPLFYVDTTLCILGDDYSNTISSIRNITEPFFLMINRGDCTFVQKVRNGQRAGAYLVIIADNACLCSDAACLGTIDDSMVCETQEPIMADDGSGIDIVIPSILLYKYEADLIKSMYDSTISNPVIMEISYNDTSFYNKTNVIYEIWTTPTESRTSTISFWETMKSINQVFNNDDNNNKATFIPQMFIYDGIQAGCQGNDGDNTCFNLCTNGGRYCATDPDNDLDNGISGMDIVRESLRWLCIWDIYSTNNDNISTNNDNTEQRWFDYIISFYSQCNTDPNQFVSDECIRSVYNQSNVNENLVNECFVNSGGLNGNVINTKLEEQINIIRNRGIVIIPQLFVDRTSIIRTSQVYTNETALLVFQSICSTLSDPSEICDICLSCDDTTKCLMDGFCDSAVSTPTVFPTSTLQQTTLIPISVTLEPTSNRIEQQPSDLSLLTPTIIPTSQLVEPTIAPTKSPVTTIPPITDTTTKSPSMTISPTMTMNPSTSPVETASPMISSQTTRPSVIEQPTDSPGTTTPTSTDTATTTSPTTTMNPSMSPAVTNRPTIRPSGIEQPSDSPLVPQTINPNITATPTNQSDVPTLFPSLATPSPSTEIPIDAGTDCDTAIGIEFNDSSSTAMMVVNETLIGDRWYSLVGEGIRLILTICTTSTSTITSNTTISIFSGSNCDDLVLLGWAGSTTNNNDNINGRNNCQDYQNEFSFIALNDEQFFILLTVDYFNNTTIPPMDSVTTTFEIRTSTIQDEGNTSIIDTSSATSYISNNNNNNQLLMSVIEQLCIYTIATFLILFLK